MSVPYYGDFPVDYTGVVIPFNAFTSDDPSASATVTDFANTDVHLHKNGSLTQRSSSAGVAIDIDVDAITGGHWITIDLSDNTDAGFYAAGSEISVRIEGVTIDGATVNAFVGSFSIERAGGTIALLKLLQTAVITNAAGADIAADIIAVKAETALIVADTGTDGVVLAADAITSAKIADNAIAAEHLAAGAIDNATFAADVGATAYATNIIALATRKALDDYDPPTKGELDTAQGAVTVSAIGNNVITAASINADAITEAKIADNAIAGEHLNATACTKIIDDFETQSQADPTGFHVNVKEVNGTAQTANDNGADINAILLDTGTDGVVVASINNNAITAAAIADAAIDNATFAADVDAGIAAMVWDAASAITLDFGTLLERAYQILNNKMLVTDATGVAALRNLADDADIATGSITDAAGTTTRAVLTWV